MVYTPVQQIQIFVVIFMYALTLYSHRLALRKKKKMHNTCCHLLSLEGKELFDKKIINLQSVFHQRRGIAAHSSASGRKGHTSAFI